MANFDINTFEEQILREAISSPEVALMRLAIEIDRQIRMILASVGILGRYSSPNPVDAIDELAKVQGATIPSSLKTTLAEFWHLRNLIVHADRSAGLALRGVDYGLRILRVLVNVPRPHYIVKSAEIELFRDSLCIFQYPYGLGVLIQSFAGDGRDFGSHQHPSTLHYEVGQDLSWEWNGTGPTWDATWFKHPLKSGAIESAWSESVEFHGRPIETL